LRYGLLATHRDAAYGEADVTEIVVGRVDIGAIEPKVVRAVSRVGGTRPIVAAGADTVK